MVIRIGNVEIARPVHRYAERRAQLSVNCLRPVTVKAGLSGASERRNHAIRGDFAHAVVEGVSHIHVAGCVYGDACRCVERGLRSGAAVAAAARNAVTGKGSDDAEAGDFRCAQGLLDSASVGDG